MGFRACDVGKQRTSVSAAAHTVTFDARLACELLAIDQRHAWGSGLVGSLHWLVAAERWGSARLKRQKGKKQSNVCRAASFRVSRIRQVPKEAYERRAKQKEGK